MDYNTNAAGVIHGDYGSDFVMGDKASTRFLTKGDLKNVVKRYKAKATEYGPKQDAQRQSLKIKGVDMSNVPSAKENFDSGTKAFYTKAGKILKDKSAKTILLE